MSRYGCRSPRNTILTDGYHILNKPRVRVIHNVANGPNVDVIVDGKVVLENVAYKAISDYLKLSEGNHIFEIAPTGTNDVITSLNANLEMNKEYTIIAHGLITDINSISLLGLIDNNNCPVNGKAHVRFIHAAAGVPAVDIIANNTLEVFTDVKYGNTGQPTYLPIDAGNVDLSVVLAGTNNVALGPIPLTLENRKVYTIVASGLPDNKNAPLSALVSVDTDCSTVNVN